MFSHTNKAIIDSRLCPWCEIHDLYWLIFIIQQNVIGILAVVSDIMLSPLSNTLHITHHIANYVKT